MLDRISDEGKTYHGPAEIGVANFRGLPEQLTPVSFTAHLYANLISALKGDTPVLRLRIWADTAPTLYTRYRIELTVAEPSRKASPGFVLQASPFPFLIVGAVLLGLGLIALASWQVRHIDWGPGGLTGSIAVAIVGGLLLIGLVSRAGAKR